MTRFFIDEIDFIYCQSYLTMNMQVNPLFYKENEISISCQFHKVSHVPLVEARSTIS